jgi:hypothetical protein
VQTLEIVVACSHCGKMVKRNACRANMRATCFDCRIVMQRVAQDRRVAQGIPAKRREPSFHPHEAGR